MVAQKISVSEFKTHCTALLRQMKAKPQRWEITNRGKVIAEVGPPAPEKAADAKEWLGSLRGTVIYGKGWDQPEDADLWEANR